ncbi:uncharacterized protein N7483_005302 [Penicillium malachiteum]|uniref:uncharacterized protein n=1 Tax=Penicillium malachiteum TaxID=1324776 RepID=UPI0025477BBD|nr:uncharacterized protein N7483_005302 [Penicillium malachiteum]KAJ5730794.1 hypothetical protein N7483_005302 [Penicillium malachiteum]
MTILGHRSKIKSSDLSLDGRSLLQQGNRCTGPGLVRQLRVSALCPHNTIFTEENVVLVHSYSTDSASVSRRCLTCRSRVEFYKLAKALHLDKEPGQVYCRFRDCNSQILASSAFCRDHILESACQFTEDSGVGPEIMINLQSQFQRSSSNPWQLREDSLLGKEVLSRIKSGILEKFGMPSAVCIDLEACVSTGRVFQVGICDLEGRKLLNCGTILSREETRRTSADPGSMNEILQVTFERKARALSSADGCMSVEQVSAKLRKLFPRPEKNDFHFLGQIEVRSISLVRLARSRWSFGSAAWKRQVLLGHAGFQTQPGQDSRKDSFRRPSFPAKVADFLSRRYGGRPSSFWQKPSRSY